MTHLNSKHHWADSPSGRLTAFFMSESDNITLFCRDARLWQFVLDQDMTLGQLSEIIDAMGAGTAAPLDADDIRWLVELGQSVETVIDHAAHDLARYGEIGVTC